MNDKQKAKIFLDWSRTQDGAIPVSLAATIIGITPQGVHSAIERRKISVERWAGHLYCGVRSVYDYDYYRKSTKNYNIGIRLPRL